MNESNMLVSFPEKNNLDCKLSALQETLPDEVVIVLKEIKVVRLVCSTKVSKTFILP